MIKLLGFKRTLILGILLGVNALLFAISMLWAWPRTDELNIQLQGLRSQISTLQTGIQNTKADMKMLQENLPNYELLLQRGFMQEQDRFNMSRALNDVKGKARLMGFSFSVGDINELQNADATAAGKRLLHSRVMINQISSPLDVNVFDMMSLLQSDFYAMSRIHSFRIAPTGALNAERLSELGVKPVTMVSSELTFDWFSLADIPAHQATGLPGGRF